MRYAIKTAPQHTTWQAMLDVFRAADDIEVFESGWTFDHFYPIFSDHTGPCLEGWVATTALAQATTRLRVGLMVTGNPYRHPAVLANMAATLDVISNGRLELGIGAGWNQQECDAYGIELPGLRERFDRFDEALEVITLLLTQETSDFDGRHYQLRDARCEPKGVQRPRVPITIGGGGEKRTLRSAARYAQHWNLAGGSPETFAHKRAVLYGHCAAIGRDPSEITTSVQVRHGADQDPNIVAEQAAAYAEVGCDLVVIPLAPPHDAGLLEPLAGALRGQVGAMPRAWSAKRERQYDHIKDSLKEQGRSEDTAEEIAARTVNKERARAGEAKTSSRSSTKDISSGRRGGLRSGRKGPRGRTKEQLYNEAKKKNVKGRSKMTKAELERAVGRG